MNYYYDRDMLERKGLTVKLFIPISDAAIAVSKGVTVQYPVNSEVPVAVIETDWNLVWAMVSFPSGGSLTTQDFMFSGIRNETLLLGFCSTVAGSPPRNFDGIEPAFVTGEF